MAHKSQEQKPDVLLLDGMSVVQFIPMTDAFMEWVDQNINEDNQLWYAGGLCVEHRYVMDIGTAMKNDGLIIAAA